MLVIMTLICVNTPAVVFSNIAFEKKTHTKGMNHLKIMKVTLTKWSLYTELCAPSDHYTQSYVHLVTTIHRVMCT